MKDSHKTIVKVLLIMWVLGVIAEVVMPKCSYKECTRTSQLGSNYCSFHKSLVEAREKSRTYKSSTSSRTTYSSTGSSSSSSSSYKGYSSSKSSSYKSDPYDVHSYSDPDDFADDWYEDFDDWDDAYDYWEDEH